MKNVAIEPKTDAIKLSKLANCLHVSYYGRGRESVGNVENKIVPQSDNLSKVLRYEVEPQVLNFITGNVSLNDFNTILYTSKQKCYVEDLYCNEIRTIVDLQKINLRSNINDFFRSINHLLPDAGMYIGCVESYDNRKIRLTNKWGKFFTKVTAPADFLYNRVFTKLSFLRRYFDNKQKVISLAETLGRLVYCGFEIIEYKEINNLHYFSVIKTREPYKNQKVNRGIFFKMNRIGKNGKIIGVYKLRTMHAYSEFLQSFVIRYNGYNEIGKPANDFRVTRWSNWTRKLYLDEIPQLLNVLKGDMNLVGVRPLGKVSFDLLPEDLKQERIKYKPGCVPPYVALRTKGLDGVLKAERIYLEEMKKGPLKTNIKYFFKAMFNLATLRISSN